MHTRLVESVTHDSTYEVKNWKCECMEYEKTGVACPHLILLATHTPEKSCIDLISPRWRKVVIRKK